LGVLVVDMIVQYTNADMDALYLLVQRYEKLIASRMEKRRDLNMSNLRLNTARVATSTVTWANNSASAPHLFQHPMVSMVQRRPNEIRTCCIRLL